MAAEIRDQGGIAVFFSCDVASLPSLQMVAENIRSNPLFGKWRHFFGVFSGPVDLVFCNAAVLRFGSVLELSEHDYEVNASVNILGHIYVRALCL